MNSSVLLFQVPLSGAIDKANGVIRGVSLITQNVQARGHDLHTDETTLKEMEAACKAKGKVPVKLNHGSGVEAVCGFVSNFRREGAKLVGDWHLVKAHPHFAQMVEKAEVMPECFGLSAAFVPKDPAVVNGKKMARVEEVLAVDCVAQPAANPEGLFDDPRMAAALGVDTRAGGDMSKLASSVPGAAAPAASTPSAEPTMADLLEAIQGLTETVNGLGERMEALEEGGIDGEGNPFDGVSLNDLTFAEVQQLQAEGILPSDLSGIDPDADLGALMADGEDGDDGQAGGAAPAPETPAAAAPAGALSALQAQVVNLSRRINAADREAEEVQLNAIVEGVEQRIVSLETAVGEKDKEITQLKSQLEAAQLALKNAGAAPAKVTVVDFSEAAPDGTFEKLVANKTKELRAADPDLTEVSAKSKAVDFCIRHHRQAYAEFRDRSSKPATL